VSKGSRASGTNPRALGTNPRALRAVKRAAKKAAWETAASADPAGLPRWLRFEILKRDGFRCRYCGAGAKDALLQVDHVKPKAKGGTDAPENLTTACVDCNGGKGASRLTDKRI
jgi:hypothetical protein